MEEEKDYREEEKEVFEEKKENFKEDIEGRNKAEKEGFEDEIETEWASALHIDFDPEEARQRAEKAATPPPVPGNQIPPVPASPQPPMQPYGCQPQLQPQPHDAPQPYNQEEMPETYLVWSVLATVFCCLIPGIVAIVYSTMVSTKYYAKDYDGARKASQMAQYWIIASVVLGVITATVYIPLALFV